jgi:cytochrome c
MNRIRTRWGRVTGAAALVTLVAASGAPVAAQESHSPSGLGRSPTAAEERDRIVGPDGADLPPGSGNAAEGAMVFVRRGCSTCHGPTGEEGPSIALVGGDVTTRTNYWPIRHWPFAPSIWDYVRRVMPYDRPGVLSDDETYAVTAYLLYRNGIIQQEEVMTAETLSEVRMPRRDDYDNHQRPGTWTPDTPRGFRILPEP